MGDSFGSQETTLFEFLFNFKFAKIKEDIPPWRRIQKGFLKYLFATFRVIFKFVNKLKLNFGIGVLKQIGSTITPP